MLQGPLTFTEVIERTIQFCRRDFRLYSLVFLIGGLPNLLMMLATRPDTVDSGPSLPSAGLNFAVPLTVVIVNFLVETFVVQPAALLAMVARIRGEPCSSSQAFVRAFRFLGTVIGTHLLVYLYLAVVGVVLLIGLLVFLFCSSFILESVFDLLNITRAGMETITTTAEVVWYVIASVVFLWLVISNTAILTILFPVLFVEGARADATVRKAVQLVLRAPLRTVSRVSLISVLSLFMVLGPVLLLQRVVEGVGLLATSAAWLLYIGNWMLLALIGPFTTAVRLTLYYDFVARAESRGFLATLQRKLGRRGGVR